MSIDGETKKAPSNRHNQEFKSETLERIASTPDHPAQILLHRDETGAPSFHSQTNGHPIYINAENGAPYSELERGERAAGEYGPSAEFDSGHTISKGYAERDQLSLEIRGINRGDGRSDERQGVGMEKPSVLIGAQGRPDTAVPMEQRSFELYRDAGLLKDTDVLAGPGYYAWDAQSKGIIMRDDFGATNVWSGPVQQITLVKDSGSPNSSDAAAEQPSPSLDATARCEAAPAVTPQTEPCAAPSTITPSSSDSSRFNSGGTAGSL